MAQHIALQALNVPKSLRPPLLASLKQKLLLFDKVGITSLQQLVNLPPETAGIPQEQANEAKWLIEEGLIFDAEMSFNLPYSVEEQMAAPGLIETYFMYFFQRQTMAQSAPVSEHEKNQQDMAFQAIILRCVAVQLELKGNVAVTPLLSYSDYCQPILKTQNTPVIQVVIDRLPMPDSSTPWEQIMDFKSDPENHANLLSLRRWVRKVASESLTPYELDDELQWLMSEFERHMRLHHIKSSTEALETVIKAPLEIIEDLLKLKFSKLTEPLFALKKRQVALMEAEINAPGREIAYLIKARQEFGGDP